MCLLSPQRRGRPLVRTVAVHPSAQRAARGVRAKADKTLAHNEFHHAIRVERRSHYGLVPAACAGYRREGAIMTILAQLFLARYESPFAAYMALQRALLAHHLSRGGSPEDWCERMAPVFRRRYQRLVPHE